jgi:hypothetical protein
VLEIERQSVENAFEDWSEKGNRRTLSSEESKLTFRKEPFSQIAGRSLHEKELETQFNEEDERGGKAPLSTREPSTDFLPAFLPSHYRPSTKKTLNAHAPRHALTPLVLPFLFHLFLVFLLRVVTPLRASLRPVALLLRTNFCGVFFFLKILFYFMEFKKKFQSKSLKKTLMT